MEACWIFYYTLNNFIKQVYNRHEESFLLMSAHDVAHIVVGILFSGRYSVAFIYFVSAL